MVMVITGIVAGMVAVFLKRPVDAYMDTARRAEMTDTADTALRRLARDVQTALPNSVRVSGGAILEFMPVRVAGRYCVEPDTTPGSPNPCTDPLDFGFSGTGGDGFDVLGPAVSLAAGDQIVVYNLGISGAGGSDVYFGTSRRAAVASAASNHIAFTGAVFPLESPGARFHVVSTPVSFVCDVANRRLLRYGGYAITDPQPDTVAKLDALATPAVLATEVAACAFDYDAELQRQGLVTVTLELSRDGEAVRLMQQINVSNTP